MLGRNALSLFKSGITYSQRKIIILASLGGIIEFYDFSIFGLYSTYFAHQIIPNKSSYTQINYILGCYLIFFLGYSVRPLGARLFKHIIRLKGTNYALHLSLALMGITLLGMALIPTYKEVGILSALILLVLRIVQGIAVGGEIRNMIIYVNDATKRKPGYAIGGILAGTELGLIIGVTMNRFAFNFITEAQMNSWGWRLPFLVGFIICLIGSFIRLFLQKPQPILIYPKYPKDGIIRLLRQDLPKTLIGVSLIGVIGCTVTLSILFMPSILIKVIKLSYIKVSHILFVTTLLSLFSTYIISLVAKRVSPYKLMVICLVGLIFGAILSYTLLYNNTHILLAVSILTIFHGFLAFLAPTLLEKLFTSDMLLTGITITYNLGYITIGCLTPIFITVIMEIIGNRKALFFINCSLLISTIIICLIGLYYYPKYRVKSGNSSIL